jgi:hypothetical protein
MADLTDEIEANAQGPKQMTVDGNSATQHDLAQQIDADRYLASREASRSAKRGLVLTKLSPPGTV